MVEATLDPKVWGVHGQLPLRQGVQYSQEQLAAHMAQSQSEQTSGDQEPESQATPDPRQEDFIRSVIMGTLYSEELVVVRGMRASFRVLRISEYDAVYEAARKKAENFSVYDAIDRNVLISEWNWRYRLVMQLQSISVDGKVSYQAPKNLEEWRSRLKLDASCRPADIVMAAWDWFCDRVMQTEALYACLASKLMKFCSDVRTIEEQLRKEAEKDFF